MPPGLSEYAWKRVAGEMVPTSESVEVANSVSYKDFVYVWTFGRFFVHR